MLNIFERIYILHSFVVCLGRKNSHLIIVYTNGFRDVEENSSFWAKYVRLFPSNLLIERNYQFMMIYLYYILYIYMSRTKGIIYRYIPLRKRATNED